MHSTSTSEIRQTPRIFAVSSMWKNANTAISASDAEMSQAGIDEPNHVVDRGGGEVARDAGHRSR